MHGRHSPPSSWLILPVVQICMNECQCVFCPEHFLLASVQPCWHLLQIIAKYSWFNSCSGPTSEGDVCNKNRQDELITNTNQIVFAHVMDEPRTYSHKKIKCPSDSLNTAAKSHSSGTYWLLYLLLMAPLPPSPLSNQGLCAQSRLNIIPLVMGKNRALNTED